MHRNVALVATLKEITANKGVTPAQLALAWVLAQRPWIVPIRGTTKKSRLGEDLQTSGIALRPEDLTAIDTIVASAAIQWERYDAEDTAHLSG